MTSPMDQSAETRATAEAYELLDRLGGATRRDRAAFTLGYTLAVDTLTTHLPADETARHVLRTHALHAICAKDFR